MTDLEAKYKELTNHLREQMNPEGFWTGELSSSALGVAVTWLWTWQTRALRVRIPFARHCRRVRGS